MSKKVSETKSKSVEVADGPYSDPYDLVNHPELVKGFQQLAESPKFKVDMSLMDEITELVSVAKEVRQKADALRLPSRYETEEDLVKLAVFFKEVQAKRDRAIEIKVEFMPLRRTLEKVWEKFLGLLYHYPSLHRMSPAPARDAAINFILSPLRDKMSQVDMIIEAASEADRNLGNAHFTFKELKAIGSIFIEAKRDQKGV